MADSDIVRLTQGQIKMIGDKIKEAGGIKTLTKADYNYPTNNPTVFRGDLAEAGIYKIDSSVVGDFAFTPGSFTSSRNLNADDMFIKVGIDNADLSRVLILKRDSTALWQNSVSTMHAITTIVRNNLTSTETDSALSAYQGKVLKDLIDSLVIKNAGAPTTSTTGTIGQLIEDTTNGDLYQLKSIDTSVTPNTYNWEQVGGSNVNVVQTIGTSTTDVMSQNATTNMVYSDSDGTSRQRICIGRGAVSAPPTGYPAIAIGEFSRTSSYHSIAIGSEANATSYTSGGYGIAIGYRAETPTSGNAIAIGAGDNISSHKTTASGARSIAIGPQAHALYDDSIALGAGAETSVAGEMNIGSSNTNYGYNSSNYRLLSGVYPGQSEHDAATVGQTLGTSETLTVSSWSALSGSDPYDYQATVSVATTIPANGTVELVNDQAVLFATHGFAIGAVDTTNNTVTIYSIGQPVSSVTLTVKVKD